VQFVQDVKEKVVEVGFDVHISFQQNLVDSHDGRPMQGSGEC
jgi:hypothetical protein